MLIINKAIMWHDPIWDKKSIQKSMIENGVLPNLSVIMFEAILCSARARMITSVGKPQSIDRNGSRFAFTSFEKGDTQRILQFSFLVEYCVIIGPVL